LQSSRQAIVDSFRLRGLRCIPQRYIVFDYLQRHSSHPTAEQILRAVNRNDPRASRASVYNGLHALVRAGLVREVALGGSAARFECHMERHHHFVCGRCGKIEDVVWFDMPDVIRRAKVTPKKVQAWELVLHGLCEFCSTHRKETNSHG